MKRLLFILPLFIAGSWVPEIFANPVEQVVCPQSLKIVSPRKIKFTPIEKRFLCGDDKVEAWKHIPLAQKKFHLESFLQDRGYFSIQFHEDGDMLTAVLGKPRKASDLEFLDAPPELEGHQRRKVVGRTLTPKLLNEVENWTKARLQSRGYPCPLVNSRGNVEDGRIEVDVQAGSPRRLMRIDEEPVPRLAPGTLRRYDAFELDEPFNDDFLTLTSRRIEEDGILQNSYFIPECDEPQLTARQENFAGKPRLFTFGIGFDTEEYLILRSTWSHNLIGSKGSKFQAKLYASYRRQEVETNFRWYLFEPGNRWNLYPVLSLVHEYMPNSHYLSANAKVAMSTTWDTQENGFYFSAGPNLNYVDTFVGAQPGVTRFLSLQYELQMMSHYYELFQNNPHRGFYWRLTGNFTNRNLLSEITAENFQLEGQYLYNILGFDPPLFILGVRGGLYGTWMERNQRNLSKLPPNYRYFLGGSTSLRGFGLNEVPHGDGALSAAFVSFEARTGNVLPLNIQPFAFLDAGMIGDQAFEFKPPLYFSPGFGIRYPSPIGVFRVTLAHGFKTGNDGNPKNTHFQFYFSFGEEF